MRIKPRPLPPPPWERPSRVVWFFLAIILAIWLTVNMPESSRKSPLQSSRQSSLQATHTEQGKQDASKPLLAPQKTDELESEDTTGIAPPLALKPAPQAITQSPPKSAPKTALEKIRVKLRSFTRLFLIVGIAAFLGGLMEARRWHMALAWIMGKLTRMARLPEIVGIAMPTALVSSAAANSILVSSHGEGHIRTSALIAGGMANSYLSYVSHSIRVMYPVLGAIGLPGFLYFTVQFSGGFLVILSVFFWNRWYVTRHDTNDITNLDGTTKPDNASLDNSSLDKSPLAWPQAIKKAAIRSGSLLFRLVYITVPLMLGIEWLLKNGAFNIWDQYIPAQVSRFFPVELVSVVASQIGGLIQSSAVSANLRAEGLIDNAQILLAMLVGSAVGNPIRTLRRNLPSALALFPVPIAITIVFSMQLSRLITTIAAIAGLIFFMQYVLYA